MVFGANVYSGQLQLVSCTGGARTVRRSSGGVRRPPCHSNQIRVRRTVQAQPPGVDPEKLRQLQEEAMKNPEVGEPVCVMELQCGSDAQWGFWVLMGVCRWKVCVVFEKGGWCRWRKESRVLSRR